VHCAALGVQHRGNVQFPRVSREIHVHTRWPFARATGRDARQAPMNVTNLSQVYSSPLHSLNEVVGCLKEDVRLAGCWPARGHG
jgi:hypothetical protein